MTNKKGFSLLELAIAGSLLGALFFFATMGLVQMQKVDRYFSDRSTMGGDLVTVVRFIMRVGRTAQLCQRNVVAGNDALECNIDFSRPASGNLQWVRFLVSGGKLQYQFDANNNGAFTSHSTRSTYPGVVSFTVCDDASMNLASGGTCAIRPDSLSTFHTNMLLPGKQGRYFRFSIESSEVSAASGMGAATLSFQGAFYRRNPTPFTNPLVVYQW